MFGRCNSFLFLSTKENTPRNTMENKEICEVSETQGYNIIIATMQIHEGEREFGWEGEKVQQLLYTQKQEHWNVL